VQAELNTTLSRSLDAHATAWRSENMAAPLIFAQRNLELLLIMPSSSSFPSTTSHNKLHPLFRSLVRRQSAIKSVARAELRNENPNVFANEGIMGAKVSQSSLILYTLGAQHPSTED